MSNIGICRFSLHNHITSKKRKRKRITSMGDCGCGTKSPLWVVVEFRQPNSTVMKVVHGAPILQVGWEDHATRGGEPPQTPSFSIKKFHKFFFYPLNFFFFFSNLSPQISNADFTLAHYLCENGCGDPPSS
jgi:hypothetical protein